MVLFLSMDRVRVMGFSLFTDSRLCKNLLDHGMIKFCIKEKWIITKINLFSSHFRWLEGAKWALFIVHENNNFSFHASQKEKKTVWTQIWCRWWNSRCASFISLCHTIHPLFPPLHSIFSTTLTIFLGIDFDFSFRIFFF